MVRPPQEVPDAELAVLQVLWERGPCSRRQLADLLYPGGSASAFTTVQKLLERLGKKGLVRRVAGVGPVTYEAAVGRDELIARGLREVADRLCGGSLTPLLMNLARVRPLTEAELEELRAFLRSQGGSQGR
jgi:predicted transcriptional regulator